MQHLREVSVRQFSRGYELHKLSATPREGSFETMGFKGRFW